MSGKVRSDAQTGAWNRDLGVDLDAARTCGATAVVTLVVRDELKLLRTRNFFKMCSEGPNCDSLFPSGPLGGGRTKRRNGAGGITLAQPEGRHFLLLSSRPATCLSSNMTGLETFGRSPCRNLPVARQLKLKLRRTYCADRSVSRFWGVTSLFRPSRSSSASER